MDRTKIANKNHFWHFFISASYHHHHCDDDHDVRVWPRHAAAAAHSSHIHRRTESVKSLHLFFLSVISTNDDHDGEEKKVFASSFFLSPSRRFSDPPRRQPVPHFWVCRRIRRLSAARSKEAWLVGPSVARSVGIGVFVLCASLRYSQEIDR